MLAPCMAQGNHNGQASSGLIDECQPAHVLWLSGGQDPHCTCLPGSERYTSYPRVRTAAPTLLFTISNFTLAHTGNLDTDTGMPMAFGFR